MNEIIIEWWVQALFGLLLGILIFIIKNLYKKINALVVGTQSILYYRICVEGERIISKGYITKQEVRDLTYFYNSYKDLNGNGVAKKLYEECMDLPIHEKGERTNEEN